VEVGVAVAVGGHQGARRGESHGNGVGKLHFELRGVSSCKSIGIQSCQSSHPSICLLYLSVDASPLWGGPQLPRWQSRARR
jgi:hypothetical protein